MEKINQYILKRTFSLNSKTPGNPIRKDLWFKKNLVAANITNNNFPDITKVQGDKLKNIDLLTYSFPCQGLSIANMGRDKGIKKDSSSTSNLIWQVYRILGDAKNKNIELPKYLLMENVKNILGPKHKGSFKRWKKVLQDFNYSTYTFILNSFKHRSLQRRERVFAISIKNHYRKWSDEDLKLLIENKYGKSWNKEERKNLYKKIINSPNIKKDELILARVNNTKSRRKMEKENHNLDPLKRKWQKGREYTFNTLTTKQDRHPNVGMIKLPEKLWEKGYLKNRFITNREAYQIMGFTSDDFLNVKTLLLEGVLTKESLYRQAGNSIVVQVLEDIFNFIKDLERGKYE